MPYLLELFGPPLLVLILISGILGYFGLHVLKRDIIFIDIAFAQFAAVGAIWAHILGIHGDSPVAYGYSIGATFVAALFYSVTRKYVTQIPLEAVIGISYAGAVAASLFLIDKGTTGHTHIQQMLTGAVLWTTWNDVLLCSLVFAVTALCVGMFRTRFEEISENYKTVRAKGIKDIAWDLGFYFLCGTVITVSVHIAGVVVVFSFLIIPSTISALFSNKWGSRMAIAWISGIIASLLGLAFSHFLDFSAGTAVALFLGLLLIVLCAARSAFRESS